MKSLENTCHTWALLQWWFTTKMRYIKCMDLYLYLLPLKLFDSLRLSLNTDPTCRQHLWSYNRMALYKFNNNYYYYQTQTENSGVQSYSTNHLRRGDLNNFMTSCCCRCDLVGVDSWWARCCCCCWVGDGDSLLVTKSALAEISVPDSASIQYNKLNST